MKLEKSEKIRIKSITKHKTLIKVLSFLLVLILGLLVSVRPKIFLPAKCNKDLAKCEIGDTNQNTPPSIEVHNIKPWDLKISTTTTADLTICDQDGDLDINTLQLNAVYPSTGQDTTTTKDKRLEYTQNDNCYDVNIKPSKDDLPHNNTIVWRFGVCDCSGNTAHTTIMTATADNYFDYFRMLSSYFLLYFIWFLILFGPQLLKPKGGKVFNSVTDESIPQCVIRIFSNEGKIVKTTATDITGIFHARLPKGTYQIMAQHQDYTFPSAIKTSGIGFGRNIYSGGSIEIKQEGAPVRIAIPMDPKEKEHKNKVIKKITSRITTTIVGVNPFILLFIIVYMSALWLRPPWTRQILLFDAVNLLILIYQLYLRNKNKTRFGKVINKEGKPVADLDLGLYTIEYDQLVEETQTTADGRFIFIAPGDKYKLKILDRKYTFADKKYSEGYPVGEEVNETIMIRPTLKVEQTTFTGDDNSKKNKNEERN